MPTIIDKEFGTITLRRSVRASSIRIRIAPDGTLRVSSPLYTPALIIKRMIHNSRTQLRELLAQHQEQTIAFEDGMQIGKSHSLIVRSSAGITKVERHKQHIIVSLNPSDSLSDSVVIEQIRAVVITALRREAKSYLPKRLAFLAGQLGFEYQKARFSHASGRWGSCSSNGTISLNIALMKLPFELIDYVLIHELSHTQQMNHSPAFWQLVEEGDPDYKLHRRQLKAETPSI